MKSFVARIFSILLISALSTVALAAEVVNVNKADAAAISQSLVGIGPIKADSIVSYRKKNGRFSSIDDLKNVDGIGPALIKKNKRYLSLNKGAVKGDAQKYAAAKKAALAAKKSKKKVKKVKKPAPKKKTTKTTKKKATKKKPTEKKKEPTKKKTKKTKPAS